jgi:hypothetical protein
MVIQRFANWHIPEIPLPEAGLRQFQERILGD